MFHVALVLLVVQQGAHPITVLRIGDFFAQAGILWSHVLLVPGLLEIELGRMIFRPFFFLEREAAALIVTHGGEFTTEIFCHGSDSR